MGERFVARVVAKGKVTIPAEIRTLHGIKDGDFVELEFLRVLRRYRPGRESRPDAGARGAGDEALFGRSGGRAVAADVLGQESSSQPSSQGQEGVEGLAAKRQELMCDGGIAAIRRIEVWDGPESIGGRCIKRWDVDGGFLIHVARLGRYTDVLSIELLHDTLRLIIKTNARAIISYGRDEIRVR